MSKKIGIITIAILLVSNLVSGGLQFCNDLELPLQRRAALQGGKRKETMSLLTLLLLTCLSWSSLQMMSPDYIKTAALCVRLKMSTTIISLMNVNV